jgi:hypothetical protein
MLNWIYVDRNTYEVKYGLRAAAQEHLTGPFDCTRQDRRMMFGGWEGFVAVEEYPGIWALYFDRDDDGLATKVAMGTRVLEVELTRREKKERKPEPDTTQAQTLDQMMRQHQEQTRRQEGETDGFLQHEEQSRHNEQIVSSNEEATENSFVQSSPGAGAGLTPPRINIAKLKLDNETEAEDVHSQPVHRAASPSAATDNLSFWSAAKKTEGAGDAASVTAASSIEMSCAGNGVAQDGPESYYKKPYVEDGPRDEFIEYPAAQ